MRVLLTTLNSKFIHSNLALRYLKASLKHLPLTLIMDEFTINDHLERVVGDIYRHKPDIIALSCYIWNIRETLMVVESIKKVIPDSVVVLGGPEVSYDSVSLLEENTEVDVIVKGEGEITFPFLIERLMNNKPLDDVEGITYRKAGTIIENRDRTPLSDLDALPFPYEEGFQDLDNRIVYYETTRGCPFQCQYCLSSINPGVRYLSLDRVRKDIKTFIDAGIPQVKLVDRTFNCNPKRARDIFRMIMEMGGNTNFHFEICGDLLDDETLDLLKDAPPGLFQFEIGVQSTRVETLEAIRRKTDFDKLSERVKILKGYRNIHLHLDLIAGLPGENYLSFQRSFNDVYKLKPDRLQLGFLKLLKGSGIRKDAEIWEYKYLSQPPYEVLENRDISYGEMLMLKDVEDLVERYYNTHRYTNSLEYLGQLFGGDYYALYEDFARYWRTKGYAGLSHSLIRHYEIFIEYGLSIDGIDGEYFKDLIRLDYASQGKPSRYPKGIDVVLDEEEKQWVRNFFNNRDNILKYLPHLAQYTPSQISRMAHIEFFDYEVMRDKGADKVNRTPIAILFDYNISNKLFERSKLTRLY
ncbi:MAG: B12-binding domain-containing radical SAM protein [Caldicoprobacterales bacterium]|jgi:radical SAM superfamily enzyme YgiQ (UPF0313 family)|nr:B12-binding domain-containing radical SAM protein [Clostridiales bacterium]